MTIFISYSRQDKDCAYRIGNGPKNMTVLRHKALNILKQDPSKGSLRQKRYKAALDDTFLLKLRESV